MTHMRNASILLPRFERDECELSSTYKEDQRQGIIIRKVETVIVNIEHSTTDNTDPTLKQWYREHR